MLSLEVISANVGYGGPPSQSFCLWEKRVAVSLGLGCPSFRGQRTVCDSSSRLLAHLVTSWSRHGRSKSCSKSGRAFEPLHSVQESLPGRLLRAGPPRQNAVQPPPQLRRSKCQKSPHAFLPPVGGLALVSPGLWHRVPVFSLLSRVRLTTPSRGRPQAGFAHLRPPLTSNVRPHEKPQPLHLPPALVGAASERSSRRAARAIGSI